MKTPFELQVTKLKKVEHLVSLWVPGAPRSVWLCPDVACTSHGTECVVISPWTATIRPQRALTAEQCLKLLLTDLVPPTRTLKPDKIHFLLPTSSDSVHV